MVDELRSVIANKANFENDSDIIDFIVFDTARHYDSE